MIDSTFKELLQEMRAARQVNEAMLAELRAIRLALPRPIDDQKGGDLLRAIDDKFGGLGFVVAELLVTAEFAEPNSKKARLANSLAAVCGQINGQRLGAWFRQHEGEVMGGRLIVRARKRGDNGVRWRVQKSDSGRRGKSRRQRCGLLYKEPNELLIG